MFRIAQRKNSGPVLREQTIYYSMGHGGHLDNVNYKYYFAPDGTGLSMPSIGESPTYTYFITIVFIVSSIDTCVGAKLFMRDANNTSGQSRGYAVKRISTDSSILLVKDGNGPIYHSTVGGDWVNSIDPTIGNRWLEIDFNQTGVDYINSSNYLGVQIKATDSYASSIYRDSFPYLKLIA